MLRVIFFCFAVFCLLVELYAQSAPPLPQRTVSVRSTQALNFGDFSLTSASSIGSVIVDFNGVRSATGSVLLLHIGNPAQQAIFEVKICPGRILSLTYPSTITLSGSNGGSMLLHIGPTNLGGSGSTFLSNKGCDDLHFIRVGGKIDVTSMPANPAGLYSGTFSLTFIQQ